MNFQPHLRKQ